MSRANETLLAAAFASQRSQHERQSTNEFARTMSCRRGPGGAPRSAGGLNVGAQPVVPMLAEMRGGPVLTHPLPQRGLTPRERRDPANACKGPSLLYRNKNGAPVQQARARRGQNRQFFQFDNGEVQLWVGKEKDDADRPSTARQLSSRERASPTTECKGPSLLYRSKHGAEQSSARLHANPERGMNRRFFQFDNGEVQVWM